MQPFKLPARAGKRQPIRLFPNYVSNGHWAVHRRILTNSSSFETESAAKAFFPKNCTIHQLEDTLIDKINTGIGDVHAYRATQYLEDSREGVHRFFQNEKTGLLVQFNVDYLDLFNLNARGAVLFGSVDGKTAFRDTEISNEFTMLIMPRFYEAKDLTVFQATLDSLK